MRLVVSAGVFGDARKKLRGGCVKLAKTAAQPLASELASPVRIQVTFMHEAFDSTQFLGYCSAM
jgi:hypothetical protein